ncbi:MAG: MmcB family DNA repair protein [Alphaproteobacteria bacterium]|nr:MmcB family DNA repair protein [Alphaproteobacteria bacterium]
MTAGATSADERVARVLARGIRRALADLGYGTLTELVLASGRRADVAGIDRRGDIVIVEIKSSLADLRADAKWPEYRDHCDALYFAVPDGFPLHVLPDATGILVADGFGAALLRDAPRHPLPAARRRAVTLRFAMAASLRLGRLEDPSRTDLEAALLA